MKNVLLATLLCFTATAYGQKETPPEGTAPIPFNLPVTEDFSLPNGMRVTIVPFGAIPRIAVRAFISAGRLEEPAGKVWLSRLTAELMKEGTATRSARQVADSAADMGGQLEIDAGADFTTAGGVVLSDFGGQFIDLLADVLQHPLLPQSELDRIKGNLARELAVSKSRPQSLARERFLQVVYPDSPYNHVFPTPEVLSALAASDVQSFYQQNFCARRTHLYIAGRFESSLKSVVEKAFSDWRPGKLQQPVKTNGVKTHSLEILDRPGAAQSTLYMGLPVPPASSPDYIPLEVMDALLGGSFGSRITSNIREEKGYTYSPFSTIARTQNSAFWVEIADVTTAVTGPSIKEINYEIDRVRKEPPSGSELKGIENYLSGVSVIRNTASADALINQLQFVDSQGLQRSELSQYVGKVNKVTPQDIQRVSESYITPAKMTIVIVGDKSKIADQGQALSVKPPAFPAGGGPNCLTPPESA